MICPECKTEAAIMESGYEVRGDRAADTKTQLYSVLKFFCRNPKCPQYGKEIGEQKTEIPVSAAE